MAWSVLVEEAPAAQAVTHDEGEQAIRTKPKLKALGLCGLVMAVMAVGTTGAAQATTGACWGYVTPELKCFSASLEARPEIAIENTSGTHPSAATLLIASMNIEITCTTATFIEGGTLAANGSILLGRLEFGGCFSRNSTAAGLKLLTGCDPDDPVTGLGKIRTEKLTGLIELHGGEPVVSVSSDSGALARIHFFEECVVEEFVLTGNPVLQDAGGKASFEEHKLSHLAQEFTGLQSMRIGLNKATIDGTSNITLATPHGALKWAGKAA